MVGTARQWEYEAADHTASTRKKQKAESTELSSLPFSVFCFLLDGATRSQGASSLFS